MIPIIFVCY
jgi:hypothetical protein